MNEIYRELNDLALQQAERMKSAETSYLHLYYGKTERPHQAIPLYENLLYALALCKTKTAEGVQEGKQIVEKILHYQNSEGLFPIYLHEYPVANDRFIAAHILPILALLDKDFQSVWGTRSNELLKIAAKKLIEGSLTTIETMPLHLQVKLIGAAKSLGELTNYLMPSVEEVKISARQADCLLGLYLASDPQFYALLNRMQSEWNPYLERYQGPFYLISFYEGQPEVNLYDLMMAGLHGKVPSHFKKDYPGLLQAALLFPLEQKGTEAESKVALSLLEKKGFERGEYPFAFQWKNGILLLETSPTVACQHQRIENGVKLFLQLNQLPNLDDKERTAEFSFFCPLTLNIQVNGEKATTFRPHDRITLEDDAIKMQFIFKSSNGIFQGHILNANIGTEWADFGSKRFNAYQRQLKFRTIAREDPCEIEIIFKYD